MFKDNSKEVKKALENAINNSLEDIGKVGMAESQLRTPVDTGKLRRSQTYQVDNKNKHVDIGVTQEAPYGVFVELGTSRQQSQPFLRDGIMNNIDKFQNIIDKHLRKLR
ncbi:HK97-gp10 family putative phage morphogenesis protein [Anaerosalibacter bizertensis]|nr:HK97-gp10 family putative phage morphogenesis protein [Anaerosalibacter bizertensis]